MKLFTFSLSAAKSEESQRFFARLADRVADSVNPTTSHVVGAASGATGLALWAEVAKHLTIVVGLAVALMALFGGAFYAVYWAVKALRELRAFRKDRETPKDQD
jgi:hypothetical protein